MYKKLTENKIVLFVVTSIIFFVPTYISNKYLMTYAGTGIRFSGCLNPILGIVFGWPAIMGCAFGNFASDLLSGYAMTLSLVGIIPQIVYGALPYYIWKGITRTRTQLTRLDSPLKTLGLVFLLAVDSILIGAMSGAMQYHYLGENFINSAIFVFLNNFVMCIIFGLPLIVLFEHLYSSIIHCGERKLSVNEKVILCTSALEILIFLFVLVYIYVTKPQLSMAEIWTMVNKICLVSGPAVILAFVFEARINKNDRLRIFEKKNGTVFTDKKKHLEFVSMPGKDKSNSTKTDFLVTGDEEVNQKVRPSFDDSWEVYLSCQKGCQMKCKVCDCGSVGFFGNVSVDEFKYQMDTILNNTGTYHTRRLLVDFGRMGEPSFNTECLEFIENELMNQVRGKISADVICPKISTMMPQSNANIKEFLNEFCRIKNNVYGGNAQLYISIDSTDEEYRQKRFSNRAMKLEEIAEIINILPEPKGDKYALSFTVSSDTPIDPIEIDRLFDKSKFVIVLEMLNTTFNGVDNGYNSTVGEERVSEIEKQFGELDWDVIRPITVKGEYDDSLKAGKLLMATLNGKVTNSPSVRKKIGIICAIEINAFFEMYPQYQELPAPEGFKLYRVGKDDFDLYILKSGMGEVAASAGVQYLITKCGVSAIINYGVVGGLTQDMKKQKVCLVNRVVHYKFDCSEFLNTVVGQVDGHDSIFLKPSENLVKKTCNVMKDLQLATVCSGDKFVGSAEEKTYLHETFDGDICDMESAGIVLTCEMNNIPCLIIKAVSDGLADGAEGFFKELELASKKSLEIANKVMEEIAFVE